MRIVINVPIITKEQYHELMRWLRSVPEGYVVEHEYGDGLLGEYEMDHPDPPEEDARGTPRRNH